MDNVTAVLIRNALADVREVKRELSKTYVEALTNAGETRAFADELQALTNRLSNAETFLDTALGQKGVIKDGDAN